MKKHRKSSMGKAMLFSPLVLFLFFVAAFASLFYSLSDEGSSFEYERAQRDLRTLSSAIQNTLLADEKFFLVNIHHASDGGSNLQQLCQRYTAAHPEIVSVELLKNSVPQWNFIADSSVDMVLRETAPTDLPMYYTDSSKTVPYSLPFQLNNNSYFEARFSSTGNELPSAAFSVYYSTEKLLRNVLHRQQMEEYEITLFAGTGKEIASTGYSNAESPLRLRTAIPGYDAILNVEIANPNYSFWTPEMILGAVLCGLLSVAVFIITFVLLRDNVKLKRAESSLRNSEERFRTIFENSADAIRLTDRYGRIVMVNSAYCDLVRTSREE
ncbi:MAG: PAS domain S-box protein, partial [Bacteroidota bacterium]